MLMKYFLLFLGIFATITFVQSITIHYNTKLRLTGGKSSSEGNVEVFHNGEWKYICDDYWDIRDAKVACRQLRFTKAVMATRG